MAFTVLVLHGPNLHLLGQEDIDARLEARAAALGVDLVTAQSNGEAGLLDALHEQEDSVDAVLVNPGALAPAAFALAEALALLALPAIEVLLSALPRERGPSALAGQVKASIHGKGADGYLTALESLVDGRVAAPGEDDAAEEDEDEAPAPRGKSLGRRAPAAAPAAAPAKGKSIGRRRAEPAPEPEAPRGKTLGRRPATGARSAVAKAAPAGLTRATVQARIAARLKGAESPDAVAAWARREWSALQQGAPCEAGAKDLLEGVLLTLMAGAKAGDHLLLSQLAKLDR